MTSRLYFRQLLSGRDFAHSDPIAGQMVNFAYVIGDRETHEAVLVDPAYAPGELVDIAAEDGMRIVGALATHHHPDHVGGTMAGFSLAGLAGLLAVADVPVHVNKAEADFVQRVTGLSATDLVNHDHDDVVSVGAVDIRLLHTPGHTPGSQCFLVDGRLVAGDTLFLEGCGRTDFPGSDPGLMFDSLQQLAALSDGVVVYPGHLYAPDAFAPLGEVKRTNYVYRVTDREQWVGAFS